MTLILLDVSFYNKELSKTIVLYSIFASKLTSEVKFLKAQEADSIHISLSYNLNKVISLPLGEEMKPLKFP